MRELRASRLSQSYRLKFLIERGKKGYVFATPEIQFPEPGFHPLLEEKKAETPRPLKCRSAA
jgi:hypothetical protein